MDAANIKTNIKVTDDELFTDIWNKYHMLVYYFMQQIIPSKNNNFDDYFQDIMMKVYQHIPDYNESYSVKTWIYRITHNYCIDLLRKTTNEDILPDDLLCSKYQPEQEIEKNEEKMMITQALSGLKEMDRQIAYLRFYEDMKYKDISIVIDMKPGTIRERMRFIKKYLRNELKDLL